jgi:predicted nucleotidyltransferase
VEPDASLFDLAAIEVELERVLGVRVDVGPAQDLREGIRERAMAQAMPL